MVLRVTLTPRGAQRGNQAAEERQPAHVFVSTFLRGNGAGAEEVEEQVEEADGSDDGEQAEIEEAGDGKGGNEAPEEGEVSHHVDVPGLGALNACEQEERRNHKHRLCHSEELAACEENVTLVLNELRAHEYGVQNCQSESG